MNAIEVKNLFFSYEDKVDVIKNISFSLPLGSYTTIIGHNGSGKSTLAKLLDGLIEKKSGEIYILSSLMNKTNINEIRKKIGIVFQNPDNQFVGSTVEDDIAFGLENRKVSSKDMHEIVNKYAELVGMKDFLNVEPNLLSGGQKQRVAIASVLSLNPEIIIFDEATAMLDPHGKKEIRQLIQKMKKENKNLTIISITHDVEEAYLSDNVIVLNKGEIFKIGTPNEIFSLKSELKEIGLQIPFFYELQEELMKNGIDVSKCKNLDEIKEVLCQLK